MLVCRHMILAIVWLKGFECSGMAPFIFSWGSYPQRKKIRTPMLAAPDQTAKQVCITSAFWCLQIFKFHLDFHNLAWSYICGSFAYPWGIFSWSSQPCFFFHWCLKRMTWSLNKKWEILWNHLLFNTSKFSTANYVPFLTLFNYDFNYSWTNESRVVGKSNLKGRIPAWRKNGDEQFSIHCLRRCTRRCIGLWLCRR